MAILSKIKYFLIGFLGGIILHYFEIKTKKINFNAFRFFIACTIFGLLTVFGQWVVIGFVVDAKAPMTEERVQVLSLVIAFIVQFVLPFIYRNPEAFAEFVFERVGVKLKDGIGKKETEEIKTERKEDGKQ